MNDVRPILVAALGNPLAGDDGFGPLVAQALQGRTGAAVEVLDLSRQSPSSLLDHLPGRTALIIVDALMCDGLAPGEVMDIGWFDPGRPALADDSSLSTHGLSVARQLELAAALQMLPRRVRLIGAQAACVSVGAPATPPVAGAVERAATRVLAWCDEKD